MPYCLCYFILFPGGCPVLGGGIYFVELGLFDDEEVESPLMT
jgi:hypothetical protein